MGPHLQMSWKHGALVNLWREPRLSSQVGTGILDALELHEGSPAASQVLRGNSGLLVRCCRRKWPHLTLKGKSRGLSQVAAGGLGFLSRYHGELREPLVLPQESQVSIRVVRASRECSGVTGGRSGLLSHGRGNIHVCRVAAGSVRSLEFPRGPEGASHVVSGKSGILLSCERPLGIPLELVQATKASFRFKAENSEFLSSSYRDIGVPLEIPLRSQMSSRVGAWNSASLSRWKRGVRPPVLLR